VRKAKQDKGQEGNAEWVEGNAEWIEGNAEWMKGNGKKR
jgi:hypothetical protein